MAASSPQSLSLDGFLPYRLSIVTNKVSRAFARLYSRRFRISIPEWRVMAVLGQAPGLSADAVCVRTQMDKVTVSRAVTKLLKKKYLIREFAEEDKRRSILELSASGHGIYAQVVPLAYNFETRLTSALSSRERKTLESLLGKLERQSDRLEASPPP